MQEGPQFLSVRKSISLVRVPNADYAQGVLETLTQTSESTISENNLIPVPFSIAEIRGAFIRSVADLMASPEATNDLDTIGSASRQKVTPEGTALLMVHCAPGSTSLLAPSDFALSSYRGALLRSDYEPIAGFQLPLREEEMLANHFTHFTDGRRRVSGRGIRESRSLDDYRYLWRGMRWAAQSILEWDTPRLPHPRDLRP